jgi:carboxymethylenebutenolidase
MCFDDQARPPAPPVTGIVSEHGEVHLQSADGNLFGAYYAYPTLRAQNGVVVMPDVRGLHSFYQELAQRFAEVGLLSVAIDYFGRTAGIGPRDGGFPYREHADEVQPGQVDLDVAAAVAWLRSDLDHDVASVFTVGFCAGGSLSWAQSGAGQGLAGCVGFYGRPSLVTYRLPDLEAPLLMLAAGQDETPVEEVERFAEQVREAGVEAELYVYPDAPHSFFDRTFSEHEAACADAWLRVLAFIERHGAGSAVRHA